MSRPANCTATGVSVRRCREGDLIERILREDYFDAPVCYFSPSLIRGVTRKLLAISNDVYFVIAEVDGAYAGFAFGHSLGPNMWRKYALANLSKQFFPLSWVIIQQFVLARVRLYPRRFLACRRFGAATRRVAQRTDNLELPRLGHSFTWSRQRANRGQVDLLFVDESCRGKGIAPDLLREMMREMGEAGVTLIESHVDPGNIASVRAFLKAGWQAFRASGNDFYLRYETLPESSLSAVDQR